MIESGLVPSTSCGPQLADEPLGSLTLGGSLRQVCQEHARGEALVFHASSGQAIRLCYRDVWDEAFAVARALAARGVTKETRVGLLATNKAITVYRRAGPIALAWAPE
jgi:fatty-acyl-CoA synthase